MEFNAEKINSSKSPEELFGILIKILEYLRSPQGCMWDREQTHESIKKNLIEEAYEAVEAIEQESYSDLKEEMGDIILQVVFHSQIANENNTFDISQVLKSIILKLIRRHPHVFGGKEVSTTREVLTNWEDIKKMERIQKELKDESIFSNIPKILPALHYAFEIQNRASRLGFDWNSTDEVFLKIEEELEELKNELKNTNSGAKLKDEVGDLLFSIVNFCRHAEIDSEQSLKNACDKFIKRFNFMEDYSKKNNLNFKDLPLEEKDKLWGLAKKNIL